MFALKTGQSGEAGAPRPAFFGLSCRSDPFVGSLVLPRFLRRPARLDRASLRWRVCAAAPCGHHRHRRLPFVERALWRLARWPDSCRCAGGHVAPRFRCRSGPRLRQQGDLRDRHSRAPRSRRLDLADRFRCRGGAPAHRRIALGEGRRGPQDLSRCSRSPHRGARALRHLAAWQPARHRRALRQGDCALRRRAPCGAAAGHRLRRRRSRPPASSTRSGSIPSLPRA